ncbi:hypothetical protein DHEL01_v210515 [Diaporthe helianthi]|uniref:2EXR domain-containing protein n=1 Tax=Diaporthe helianthi TaxID=158607 RepID=A0A2P5HLG1_DIAHE|nr:hypothetical protein DHEL01_v210515 [Diaporthe helianthi]
MAETDQTNLSPLFAVLPAELRLQIYEELFEGSRVHYKKKHTVGNRTQLSILLPSNHCNFLFTCEQAYDEALKTYWRKTTLYGDPDDDELTFFLGCIVPDYAKPLIRHISGLNSGELPDRPLAECLKDYRALQTIGFEERWFVDLDSLGDHGGSPTMKEWAEENCMAESCGKVSKLVYDGGPEVVFRGVYSLAVGVYSPELLEEKFPNGVEDFENEREVCLYNCSKERRSFDDVPPQQKDQGR